MTVEDKAQNILRLDFTEIVRFEVTDPDTQITAYAIPQELLKVSGDEQEGPAGEALPAPFVVSVLDQNQGLYPGAPVTFEITGGQGSLSVETTATDSTGKAATFLTLDQKLGINRVEVLVAGLLPVTFTARGTGNPQNLTKVSGLDQQGPAGGAIGPSVCGSGAGPIRQSSGRRHRHLRGYGRGRIPPCRNRHHRCGRPRLHHPDPGPRARQKYRRGKGRRPQARDLQRHGTGGSHHPCGDLRRRSGSSGRNRIARALRCRSERSQRQSARRGPGHLRGHGRRGDAVGNHRNHRCRRPRRHHPDPGARTGDRHRGGGRGRPRPP